MKLSELPINEERTILISLHPYIQAILSLRHRLLEMGIIPGTKIKITKVAPLGDPLLVHLRGYELSIRKSDAELIEVE